MTKSAWSGTDERGEPVPATSGPARCQWCRRPIPARPGPGRPRLYCRQSCRQRDYEARRRSEELGLSEAEVVLTRAELDRLTDQLYVLEAALEDVERDLAQSAELDDYRSALTWVLEAARPLVAYGQARSG